MFGLLKHRFTSTHIGQIFSRKFASGNVDGNVVFQGFEAVRRVVQLVQVHVDSADVFEVPADPVDRAAGTALLGIIEISCLLEVPAHLIVESGAFEFVTLTVIILKTNSLYRL